GPVEDTVTLRVALSSTRLVGGFKLPPERLRQGRCGVRLEHERSLPCGTFLCFPFFFLSLSLSLSLSSSFFFSVSLSLSLSLSISLCLCLCQQTCLYNAAVQGQLRDYVVVSLS